MTTQTPTATQPNSRKDVRNAITATARKFASLREQWVIRTDLADLVERTQAALTAATTSLSGSKPTEVVREAQATAGTLLLELVEALSKPAVETPSTRAIAATGNKAWFVLMNPKTRTVSRRFRGRTRPRLLRGCHAPA